MAYSQAAIISTAVALPVIAGLLVALRFWTRMRFQKTFLGVDDWLILTALVINMGMSVGYILGATIGVMGRQGMPVPDSHTLPQKKLDFAQLTFEKPAYGAIKLSVLFFYRRIFVRRLFKIVTVFAIALVILWTLTFFLADLFSCGSHIDANWDSAVKAQGYCLNTWVLSFVFSVTDVLTDIGILLMPYPEIRRLQMSSRYKWAVAGVFMMGFLDLIMGIIRFGFIIATQTVPAFNTHYNPPEAEAPGFWTFIEVVVGIIAANLPALAPLCSKRQKTAFLKSRNTIEFVETSLPDRDADGKIITGR